MSQSFLKRSDVCANLISVKNKSFQSYYSLIFSYSPISHSLSLSQSPSQIWQGLSDVHCPVKFKTGFEYDAFVGVILGTNVTGLFIVGTRLGFVEYEGTADGATGLGRQYPHVSLQRTPP